MNRLNALLDQARCLIQVTTMSRELLIHCTAAVGEDAVLQLSDLVIQLVEPLAQWRQGLKRLLQLANEPPGFFQRKIATSHLEMSPVEPYP